MQGIILFSRKIRRLLTSLLIPPLFVTVSACQSAPSNKFANPADSLVVNGRALPYKLMGKGPPVVLIHGALSDLRTWTRQQQALSSLGYSVVTFTQRYYGLQSWETNWPPYRIRTHADDLKSFLRLLKLGKVHLVAWSSGGHIAITVAKEAPELVNSVFIYEPVVASYIEDLKTQHAIGNDAEKMLAPVFESLKTGDFRRASQRFLDSVSSTPGYWSNLNATGQEIVLDNARVLPIMFDEGETDMPVTCLEMSQILPPVTIARGALSRPFFRLIADAASVCLAQNRHLVIKGAHHMWPSDEFDDFTLAVDNAIKDAK